MLEEIKVVILSLESSTSDILEEISLIFWNKHVALLITKDTIIHSNAYHMCVQKENVDQAIKRFEKQNNKILKIKKIIL